MSAILFATGCAMVCGSGVTAAILKLKMNAKKDEAAIEAMYAGDDRALRASMGLTATYPGHPLHNEQEIRNEIGTVKWFTVPPRPRNEPKKAEPISWLKSFPPTLNTGNGLAGAEQIG